MTVSDEDWIKLVAEVHHRDSFPEMTLKEVEEAARAVLKAVREGKKATEVVPGDVGKMLGESFRALAAKNMLGEDGNGVTHGERRARHRRPGRV